MWPAIHGFFVGRRKAWGFTSTMPMGLLGALGWLHWAPWWCASNSSFTLGYLHSKAILDWAEGMTRCLLPGLECDRKTLPTPPNTCRGGHSDEDLNLMSHEGCSLASSCCRGCHLTAAIYKTSHSPWRHSWRTEVGPQNFNLKCS